MKINRTNRSEGGQSLAPAPHMLLGLESQKWTPTGAISELADNAFGEARGNASRLVITYDPGKRILSVFDNGRGMEHVVDLFRLGQTARLQSASDIGRYGMGGSMALIWLAEKASVFTMRGEGEVMRDTVVWSQVRQVESLADVEVGDEGWIRANVSNTPVELLASGTGTLIRLHLRRKHRLVFSAIERELTETYAPGLRSGRKIIIRLLKQNGNLDEERILTDSSLIMPREKSKRANFDLTFEYEGKHLSVHGAFGLFGKDEISYSRSIASIGFGHRVITKTRDCYNSPTGENFSGRGVAGYVDLGPGWQEYLTTTKEDINEPELRAKLMGVIHEGILPLLRQTEDEAQTIVLRGIALDLQIAFNQLSDKSIKVSVKPGEDEGKNPGVFPDIEGLPTGVITDGPERNRGMKESNQEGDKETDQKAETHINLVKSKNDEIDERLSRCSISSDQQVSIKVEVNIDHPVVLALLQAEPVNRMGLNLLATGDIAREVAKHPTILRRALTKQRWMKLESLQSDDDRAGLLARWLMDAAVGNFPSAAAA